jgi:hypothetical protein
MFLHTLTDATSLFASLGGSFIGIGMTAFSRTVPFYFITSYHVACLRKTRDLPLLRKKGAIFCLEECIVEPFPEVSPNSAGLLMNPLVKDFLNRLPRPVHLILYQNYPEIEALAEQEGWVLIANPAALRLRLSQRSFFKTMGHELGLPCIPGAIHNIEELHRRSYSHWAKTLGTQFVVQLPDLHQGGGKGTFFVRSPDAYVRLQERLKNNLWRGIPLNSVSLRSLMEGMSVSVAMCLTQHGILISGPQRQLVDLPHCRQVPEDGVFCGHSWGEKAWPPGVCEQVLTLARSIGNYLGGLGYKGILGIDFLVSASESAVYPLEINPRFTGAFPMLSLLHLHKGIIPLDVFHLLEFLRISYQIDVEAINAQYAEPVKGGHLLVFSMQGRPPASALELIPGLYEHDSECGHIHFMGEASDFSHIQNDRQFILIEGPPESISEPREERRKREPFHRVGRLLFGQPIVDAEGTLIPLARRFLNRVCGPILEDP